MAQVVRPRRVALDIAPSPIDPLIGMPALEHSPEQGEPQLDADLLATLPATVYDLPTRMSQSERVAAALAGYAQGPLPGGLPQTLYPFFQRCVQEHVWDQLPERTLRLLWCYFLDGDRLVDLLELAQVASPRQVSERIVEGIRILWQHLSPEAQATYPLDLLPKSPYKRDLARARWADREQRERIMRGLRRSWADPDKRTSRAERQRQAQYARFTDPQERQKHAESSRRGHEAMSPERRAQWQRNRREALKRALKSDETRAKLRERQKERLQDPQEYERYREYLEKAREHRHPRPPQPPTP